MPETLDYFTPRPPPRREWSGRTFDFWLGLVVIITISAVILAFIALVVYLLWL